LLPFSYHFLFARIREVFQVQILISLLIGRWTFIVQSLFKEHIQ
jgi:hypothetical protein